MQHPADGDKLYYLPLASGYWKLFGTPLHDFWCCTGSMAESFAKLGDSIYFHDDSGVYVNLFVPSELTWAERGVQHSARHALSRGGHVASHRAQRAADARRGARSRALLDGRRIGLTQWHGASGRFRTSSRLLHARAALVRGGCAYRAPADAAARGSDAG